MSNGCSSTHSVRLDEDFRLPDASVDSSLVAADIKDIGSKGSAGIELVNYYMVSK